MKVHEWEINSPEDEKAVRETIIKTMLKTLWVDGRTINRKTKWLFNNMEKWKHIPAFGEGQQEFRREIEKIGGELIGENHRLRFVVGAHIIMFLFGDIHLDAFKKSSLNYLFNYWTDGTREALIKNLLGI